MILNTADIWNKMAALPETLQALSQKRKTSVPDLPARDVEYLPISLLPSKKGLSTLVGQQKLLHDLANIELQAMELGVRSLIEFPDAHPELREQLIEIVCEEARHLKICLQALEQRGGHWGQFPVHLGLWNATHSKDSLLERLFIVHRYLEGSGLDSGDTLLRRLSGVNDRLLNEVVKTIVDEEVGHVEFGSRWFRHYAEAQKVDAQQFFKRMLPLLQKRHPRNDKISEERRQQAGFSEVEIECLQDDRRRRLG